VTDIGSGHGWPYRSFDLLDHYNPTRGSTGNVLADSIRREREQQIRYDMLTGQSPDQMARTVRTARDLGIVPADIEDSVDEAEKSLRANNFGKLIDQHPAIGQWAAGDPRGAVAASDDTKSLGILGSAWDMFKRSKNPVLAFAAGVDAFDRADLGRYARGGAPGLRAGAPALLATAAAIMGDPVAQAAMPSPARLGRPSPLPPKNWASG
jgi:hypothetical protein